MDQNIYIIWEIDKETKEEKFINVAWNLKSALDWCKTGYELWGEKYSYKIGKYFRSGIDSLGWREWMRDVVIIKDKAICVKPTKK